MLVVQRLLKLAVICVIFFTVFDLIQYGHITWIDRLIGR
ncbi:Membrane protein [Vibrio rotiferianus]|nr:Membrane protein [Vibrio rotiferianus]